MSFYDSNERQPKEIIAGFNPRTFWGDKMTVALVALEPHVILSSHSHLHEQAGYVLAGEIEFPINGPTQGLRPGDVYIIPGNAEHSVKVGDLPTRLFETFAPVREDLKY